MEKRNTFSGTLGFVLAAAGSAVGLGNIWRFPYLAAKDGGGLFILVYIILAMSFGFTLLINDISIGRITRQSALTAYGSLNKKWRSLGALTTVVPFLITMYYCVIGGWVIKYAVAFITGHGADAAQDGYFSAFISSTWEPAIYSALFLLATTVIVLRGVHKGIESSSRILMPILFFMIIGIAIFSITIKSSESGAERTGLQGLRYLVVPDFSDFTLKDLAITVNDAMGQLFYSISASMGIMITYGSYLGEKENISRSVSVIEIFDTLAAFLAGAMIIPAVYVFMGTEGMRQGPGLMFEAMPKIFAYMGPAGNILGAVFFLMVLFAALTSSVSLFEAVVSSLMDGFKMQRTKACITEAVIALVAGIIIVLGYSVLYFDFKLPNGQQGQLLDVLDFLSNNIAMPIVAIGSCIFVGWVLKPDRIIAEVTRNGEKFRRKGIYTVMVKYIAPVLLFFILLGSFGLLKVLD